MNLYFRLFLIVPFLIFVLPVFSAQNVFVLGSFKSLEAAHEEAYRISDELGVDLLVKEVPRNTARCPRVGLWFLLVFCLFCSFDR